MTDYFKSLEDLVAEKQGLIDMTSPVRPSLTRKFSDYLFEKWGVIAFIDEKFGIEYLCISDYELVKIPLDVLDGEAHEES